MPLCPVHHTARYITALAVSVSYPSYSRLLNQINRKQPNKHHDRRIHHWKLALTCQSHIASHGVRADRPALATDNYKRKKKCAIPFSISALPLNSFRFPFFIPSSFPLHTINTSSPLTPRHSLLRRERTCELPRSTCLSSPPLPSVLLPVYRLFSTPCFIY